MQRLIKIGSIVEILESKEKNTFNKQIYLLSLKDILLEEIHTFSRMKSSLCEIPSVK